MSCDREIMVESRIRNALGRIHNEVPSARITIRIAALAAVTPDEACAALERLESRGMVLAHRLEIEGVPHLTWKLLPTVDEAKTAPEPKAAEWPEMTEVLRAHAVAGRRQNGLEQPTVRQVAGRLARAMMDQRALPGLWDLMPAYADTSTINVTGAIRLTDETGEEREWKIGSRADIPEIYLLTDIPHPDNPDRQSVYCLNLGAEIDRMAEHLQMELEAAA